MIGYGKRQREDSPSRSGLYRKLSRQHCGVCLNSGVTKTVNLLDENRMVKRSDNGCLTSNDLLNDLFQNSGH